MAADNFDKAISRINKAARDGETSLDLSGLGLVAPYYTSAEETWLEVAPPVPGRSVCYLSDLISCRKSYGA
jgi:hypothetical protein